jgi:hypothetical protein
MFLLSILLSGRYAAALVGSSHYSACALKWQHSSTRVRSLDFSVCVAEVLVCLLVFFSLLLTFVSYSGVSCSDFRTVAYYPDFCLFSVPSNEIPGE